MPVSAAQKAAIEAVLAAILAVTTAKRKRQLAGMFLDLVDRASWPEYYEVIPTPRCLHDVQAGLARGRYRDPLQAYEDLALVFLNALFYNEDGSQIAKDASTLKAVLDREWRARAVLPAPPEALPASSAQATHGVPLPRQPPDAAKLTLAASPRSAAAPSPKRHADTSAPASTSASTPATTAPASSATTAPASTATAPASATAALPSVPAPAHIKSPERAMSPEMDVDVGGTPELESAAQDMALDSESDAIVQQLERGLPRWEGFADVGWNTDMPKERFAEVVDAIKEHLDDDGNKLAASLEVMPEDANIPEVPYKEPLSLSLIESRVRSDYYETSAAFDKDMCKLFLKARRWYEPASEAYGNVLLLQRLYQALSSADPPPGPPYTSTTHFASLPAGPGTAKPLHSTDAEGVPGVTTFRVSNKDRRFVDEVCYKGWAIRLADWLHLANCDDPSRPIVAQVFRCWTSEEPSRKGQPGITVCWYFRPEQTFHPVQRQFWEREVFKTSHFADHPLEDLIEKIACQFTARHIRGRPRAPFWHPGWPLYVCDSRYNDRERIFVKIKNWNSCVPEEVRKSAEFMPIYPFEKPVFPRRFASPFLAARPLRAPGGIGDVLEKAEGEKIEGGGIGRKRARKSVAGQGPSRSELTDRLGQSKGLYVGPPLPGAAPPTPAPASAPQPPPPLPGRPPSAAPAAAVDRSIVAAAGGAAALGGNAVAEKLPPETAKFFDRDPETNEVLWFAAPPVDIVHPPGPKYSMEYLHFLARKRKAEAAAEAAPRDDAAMDVDGAREPPRKERKIQLTVTERLSSILAGLPTSPS